MRCLISFVVEGKKPKEVEKALDAEGIAVCAGKLAAEPLLKALGADEAVRASFMFYNTRQADAQILSRHIVCHSTGQVSERHFHQFYRDPLARAAVVSEIVAAALRNQLEGAYPSPAKAFGTELSRLLPEPPVVVGSVEV
ncbi:MAG TPA: aminotransferase class V-fold PLP-dependent enzyme [Pyrinomonadaceae bacterium]|jgi:hypothetical protein